MSSEVKSNESNRLGVRLVESNRNCSPSQPSPTASADPFSVAINSVYVRIGVSAVRITLGLVHGERGGLAQRRAPRTATYVRRRREFHAAMRTVRHHNHKRTAANSLRTSRCRDQKAAGSTLIAEIEIQGSRTALPNLLEGQFPFCQVRSN